MAKLIDSQGVAHHSEIELKSGSESSSTANEHLSISEGGRILVSFAGSP